jgi:hypothetical protein
MEPQSIHEYMLKSGYVAMACVSRTWNGLILRSSSVKRLKYSYSENKLRNEIVLNLLCLKK